MPTIQDAEFGEIVIRRHHNATRTAISIAPDGRLKVSTSLKTPTFAIKALIKSSRGNIRQLLEKHQSVRKYDRAQQIGKSHSLLIQPDSSIDRVDLTGTKIIVSLSKNSDISDNSVQSSIRQVVIKALRKEAKSYLPRRLKYLAQNHSFTYEKVKLTHASSRWGSCSSRGTISLNIALMRLPFEIIDYVIIHELCHTKQMNHSKAFWAMVEMIDPRFKINRRQLKIHTPNI